MRFSVWTNNNWGVLIWWGSLGAASSSYLMPNSYGWHQCQAVPPLKTPGHPPFLPCSVCAITPPCLADSRCMHAGLHHFQRSDCQSRNSHQTGSRCGWLRRGSAWRHHEEPTAAWRLLAGMRGTSRVRDSWILSALIRSCEMLRLCVFEVWWLQGLLCVSAGVCLQSADSGHSNNNKVMLNRQLLLVLLFWEGRVQLLSVIWLFAHYEDTIYSESCFLTINLVVIIVILFFRLTFFIISWPDIFKRFLKNNFTSWMKAMMWPIWTNSSGKG